MQIAVSVLGRFHAFNLAQQMEKLGALNQLLTSYPSFAARRFGVPRAKISSYVALEMAKRTWQRLPARIRAAWNSQLFFHSAYDRFAAGKLREGADLFVTWSGSSLRAMRRARQLGMVRVLERCSSHMLVQQEILEQEYRLAGLDFKETHLGAIAQELAEYEEAEYISVPSDFVKHSFIQQGISAEKLLQVPYAVDLRLFQRGFKQDKVFRVMYCGALTLRKGLPYLLRAFAELNLPNAELSLVGSISDQAKPLLARYRDFRIVAHGPHPQRQLCHFYNQANVFCLASVEEGMAYVVLQAMACGLPVIATTNTGAADVVREGVEGFIVPIRSVEAIKEKILWCYEHQEEAREMGRSAHQRVSDGFTWDDYGKRAAAVYSMVLGKSGRGHLPAGDCVAAGQ